MGKCPHCDTDIAGVEIQSVTLTNATLTQWTGLSYSCPNCHAILNVGFDPVAERVKLLESLQEFLASLLEKRVPRN